MNCPNCGAQIQESSRTCECCGTPITMEMQRQREQLNKKGCPSCGSTNISFSREKQGEVRGKNGTAVVRSTVGVCKDCGYTWTTNVNTNGSRKKKNTWLWVLGWICIFPLPLTLILLRKKDMKPALKYGIIAAAWIVYLLIGLCGNSDTETKSVDTTEHVSVERTQKVESEENTLTFVIRPEEKGEYGFENVLNAGTDLEERKIMYHIPSGTYSVKNLGEYTGQLSVCSDETHITEEGWEEPATVGDIVLVDPGKTAEFTINDGFYLEINVNGELEFTKIRN